MYVAEESSGYGSEAASEPETPAGPPSKTEEPPEPCLGAGASSTSPAPQAAAKGVTIRNQSTKKVKKRMTESEIISELSKLLLSTIKSLARPMTYIHTNIKYTGHSNTDFY